MLVSCNPKVSRSFFNSNKGGIGGAIRFKKILPAFLSDIKNDDFKQAEIDSEHFLAVAGNYFKGNQAIIMGPDIGGIFTKIEIEVSSEEGFAF